MQTVTLGVESICMTHFRGEYAALDNKCPHQGGPLGEGSIEGCYLRCPWHGWDYDPVPSKNSNDIEVDVNKSFACVA